MQFYNVTESEINSKWISIRSVVRCNDICFVSIFHSRVLSIWLLLLLLPERRKILIERLKRGCIIYRSCVEGDLARCEEVVVVAALTNYRGRLGAPPKRDMLTVRARYIINGLPSGQAHRPRREPDPPTDRPTGYYSNTSHTHIYGERDKRRLLSSSVNISGPYNGPANGRSRSWCPPSTVELVLGRHGQSAPYIFIYIPAILPDHHHPSSRLHRKRKWTNSSFSQRSFVAHIDDVYVYMYIYTRGFSIFPRNEGAAGIKQTCLS